MILRSLAAAFVALPVAAAAETVTLSAPLQAATVHHATVDMSVYWTKSGEALEVVAHYASKANPEDTGRLVLALNEGDDVLFGLPGQAGQLFGFSRHGDALTVATARPSMPKLALN